MFRKRQESIKVQELSPQQLGDTPLDFAIFAKNFFNSVRSNRNLHFGNKSYRILQVFPNMSLGLSFGKFCTPPPPITSFENIS